MASQQTELDTTIAIVTPENIAFEYRVAGPFRRFPALVIDLAIRSAVYFLLLVVGGMTIGMVSRGMLLGISIVAWFALDWFYGGVFETYMNGQTPGKKIMGIRVLTTEGRPINGMQAVIRNVLRAADMLPTLSLGIFGGPPHAYVIPVFIVGLTVMAMNRKFQRLGDLVCGTMVVIEERRWLMGVAKLDDPRAAKLSAYLPANFQASRSLAQALAMYVDRRRYFTPARRREVARHLAEPLLERFGMRRDTSHDLLLCAMYYRTFVADRVEDDRPGWADGSSPFGQSKEQEMPA